MDKLINHPIIVGDPDQMKRDPDSGQPICPECQDRFFQCPCPKPWSSLETDGFQVRFKDGSLIAYPCHETYVTESLWITGTPHQLRCGICEQTLDADDRWSDISSQNLRVGPR